MSTDHQCKLPEDPDLVFPIFTSNSPCCATWIQRLRLWCSISSNTPRCRQYVTSMAAVALERKRQARVARWWIIHPFSRVRFIWEVVMTVTYMTAFSTIPFMTCFVVLDYNRIRLDKLNLPIYAICWLDIIANCITGIYSRENRESILDQKKILTCYLKGFFLIDVVTSVPYDHITLPWRNVPGPDSSLAVALVNLVPKLKIIRYLTLISYLRRLFMHFQIQEFPFQMFITFLLALYVIHWFACFCYAVTVLVMYAHQVSAKECTDCWLAGVGDAGIPIRYEQALFIVVENFAASCLGLFPPEKEGHSLICTFLMVIGRVFESYIIIMFLQIRANSQASTSKFEEIVDQLSAYVRQKQLPQYMKKRILAYYHYRFRNSYFREKLILSSVSERIRGDIVLHTCGRLVENVMIFRDLPKNILTSIVVNLKLELYLPNDVIIKAGTHGDCMFFLSSGTVAVLTPTGKEICHLDDGAHFGEVALLMQNQRRVASVVAIEVCEVYRLDRKDFRKCIAVHSDLFAKIERIAMDRMEKTIQAEEQHKRFLLQRTSRFSSSAYEYSRSSL